VGVSGNADRSPSGGRGSAIAPLLLPGPPLFGDGGVNPGGCEDAKVPPEPPSERSELVVLCSLTAAIERIRSRFPSVEVVDISAGVPTDVRGEVLFGGWGPADVEAMARGVRWVQMAGTGIDNTAPEVRSAAVLTSSRGASAVAISEYVIAAMGAFARNWPDNWLRAAPDRWNEQPAASLAGATVALFGFGGIAQRVARIALAMEMSVVAQRRGEGPSPVPGVELVGSFADLVASAEHVVLAAPATAQTRHVVNADSLARMRPGVHLVNIARGSLIDQDALRVALDDGPVARATLDVTDPEPLPAGHWLYEHPKVFLTPHASWAGPPPFQAATEQFCDNLGRYLAGEPLVGVVGEDGY
jgi:phosphoglycerate dehydrogenase-like enzyme